MSNKDELKEFEILGHRVRFRPDNSGRITADRVVKLIKDELNEIDHKMDLSKSSIRASDKFLLVALKLANDKLFVEEEVRNSISSLEQRMNEAQIIIDGQLNNSSH